MHLSCQRDADANVPETLLNAVPLILFARS